MNKMSTQSAKFVFLLSQISLLEAKSIKSSTTGKAGSNVYSFLSLKERGVSDLPLTNFYKNIHTSMKVQPKPFVKNSAA